MVNASLISRLSQAVDQIENRLKQNRPWKVLTVRRGLHEDGNAARDSHYAAHPKDRDANIVIFKFCDDEEMADESQVCTEPAGSDFSNRAGHRGPRDALTCASP
jgi:hypothetical protein